MSQTQQLLLTQHTHTHEQNRRLHEQTHHLALPQQSISHILSNPTLSTGLPPPTTVHPPPPPHSSVPTPKASSHLVGLAHFEVASQATPSHSSYDEPNNATPTIDQCRTYRSHPFPPSLSPNADSTVEDDSRTHSHSTRSSNPQEGRNEPRPTELCEHSLPLIPPSITYTTGLQTGNGVTAGSMDSSQPPDSHLLPSFPSLSLSFLTSLDGCRMSREVPSNTIPHTLSREGPIFLKLIPLRLLVFILLTVLNLQLTRNHPQILSNRFHKTQFLSFTLFLFPTFKSFKSLWRLDRQSAFPYNACNTVSLSSLNSQFRSNVSRPIPTQHSNTPNKRTTFGVNRPSHSFRIVSAHFRFIASFFSSFNSKYRLT